MDQTERRLFLINSLLSENDRYKNYAAPSDEQGQRDMLRSLMNVRMPAPLTEEYKRVESEYLAEDLARRGVTDADKLEPVEEGIYLWQGDITTLRCGAVVNAANSGMLGCFVPLHKCIDNCIHTYAGAELRNFCAGLMERQGHEEPTGQAKATPAFNLPCKYVIHTVGPIVNGRLTARHGELLSSSYRSCLETADELGVDSLAFCCISTGVFGYPPEEAAKVAVRTVREYRKMTGSRLKIIFNVFKDSDLEIYKKLLG